MNKRLTKLLVTAAAGGTAGLIYLIAPGEIRTGMRLESFYGRNIAHRGLHGEGVPENSLTAFRLAVANGYGAEFDVHLTADGQLVVFHDDDLKRVCGEEGRINEMTLAQLREYRLLGTEEGIPTLVEVLSVLKSMPLIVELKRGGSVETLCEKTLTLLDGCGSPFCVESFDPFIVAWFRKNAPDVLRGQLSAPPKDLEDGASKRDAFLVGNLLTNFLSRPHFVAYKIGRKPLTVKLCESLGALRVAWTSKTPGDAKRAEVVIFEGYRPKP